MSTVDGVKGVLVCLESEGSAEDRPVIFSGKGNACHVTWGLSHDPLSGVSVSLCRSEPPDRADECKRARVSVFCQ